MLITHILIASLPGSRHDGHRTANKSIKRKLMLCRSDLQLVGDLACLHFQGSGLKKSMRKNFFIMSLGEFGSFVTEIHTL